MSDRRGSWSRREFVGGLTLAASAGFGMRPERAAAEPPPEITRLRLSLTDSVCTAPESVADALLQSEGFTDVQYVRISGTTHEAVAAGKTDIDLSMSPPLMIKMDAGAPLVILAGSHVGCFELIGGERVRGVRDLKGKVVAVRALGSTEHVFLSVMLAYVGVDPRRDVTWVSRPLADSIALLQDKKVDALMAFPPHGQELRAKKIGRVVVNSTVDRPWSQYFCCVVGTTREFVRRYPVATKRALRAILKATDLCALEPDRVARMLVDRGVTGQHDYALQALKEIPYRWREYDPEDTVRFYALRLHEIGMIKSSPQQIIAQGTEWRFLNELKRELKG